MSPLAPAGSNLIALLRDGEKGFTVLSEHVAELKCRMYLIEESIVRGMYADKLESLLADRGMATHETGTSIGALHRGWLEIKAGLGAGDASMINSMELCDRAALAAYEVALEDESLPQEFRTCLRVQADHVHHSIAFFKNACGGVMSFEQPAPR